MKTLEEKIEAFLLNGDQKEALKKFYEQTKAENDIIKIIYNQALSDVMERAKIEADKEGCADCFITGDFIQISNLEKIIKELREKE